MASGVAGALTKGVVSAGIGLGTSALAGRALGGDANFRPPTPLSLSAGGLSSASSGGQLSIQTTPGRRNLVNNLSRVFQRQAGEFGNLRGIVRPGFGALTEARVNTLESRGARRLSNLRENLATRRISGSSFGQAQLQSEQRQLDQDIAEARARSFLEELDITTTLIDKQYSSDLAAFETLLSELNTQAQVGQALLSGTQAVLSNNASLQAQLAVQNAQGVGAFIEPYVSQISGAAGDFAEGLVS